MLTILHASDLHFGRHFSPDAAEAFRDTLENLSPDLLVFSGDFTQRAKVREYQEARTFLGSLPPLPKVVVPGNHDVPLYRIWERAFAPLRNYREFIARDVDTVTRIPGATIVALNSTAPLQAIVNGRVRARQLLFAAESFKQAPDGDLRVVVLHHHLVSAPDYESDQVLPGYQRCLDAFSRMEVDLILGGHLHRAFVANSLDARPSPEGTKGIVVAHTGTTTSLRGRAREKNKNTFNLVLADGETVAITHYQLLPGGGRFVPVGTHLFPRGAAGGFREDPARGLLQDRLGGTIQGAAFS